MQNIKADIVNGSFKRVYLLHGEEEYLVRRYRDSLKKAVMAGDDSEMNYNHYTGQDLDVNELKDICLTLPFFADRRAVLLENSGLFGGDADFADFIKEIPDSTVLIMVERSADKRSRLYKEINKLGYVCEFEALKPDELSKFVAAELYKAGKRIRQDSCEFFVANVGGDLYNVVTELEKLINYCGDREVVNTEDIEAICTMQVENKIFDIVDALNRKDRDTAMKIFYDLLALRESPLGLLRFMVKQYMKLSLQVDMINDRYSDVQIAQAAHMPEWLVRKNRAKLRGVSPAAMKKAVDLCVKAEQDIKTGQLSEQIGLEILLANLVAL